MTACVQESISHWWGKTSRFHGSTNISELRPCSRDIHPVSVGGDEQSG